MYHDVKTKFVFDLNEDLARQVAGQLGAQVTSKEALINNSDIIVIATPPSSHYQLITEALQPGKKVICEKPFVGTLKECNELIALATSRNAELFVAHFRRTFPSVKLAQSIVQSGLLGDITSIEVYEGGKFSWQTKSGYVYQDPYGGVLFDTGSHTIDMALFMANLDDKPVEISSVDVKKDKPEPAHEIQAALKLQPALGQEVTLKVKLSRRLLLSNKVKITGTQGWIDVPIGVANYIRLGGPKSSTVVYADIKYDELMEAFAMQFKDMFYDVKNSPYKAGRFANLTHILETIANS
ncbi:hypothetical protein GCM10027037_35250 [Mucilaginibacter koreensis]